MSFTISITIPKSDLTLHRTRRGTWVHGLWVDAAEKFSSMDEAYRKILGLGDREDGICYQIAAV